MLRLLNLWDYNARPEQMAPDGAWATWLIMAGRGFGKTRAGAEWVRALAERRGAFGRSSDLRIALVAASLDEARAVMVEGRSGILGIAAPGEEPRYEPSLRRLSWPSGATAMLYSAGEPDSLRGAEFHYAWADEIGKWAGGCDAEGRSGAEAAWDNLKMALRLGRDPQAVATTTPRPVALIRRLVAEAARGDGRTIVTRGASWANRANLPPTYLAGLASDYGGTRLGRQELLGELIEDVEGALWTRAMIEKCRIGSNVIIDITRVAVAVDPPASAGGDACGIVAAALLRDGRIAVIEDASVGGLSPEGWANAVALCAARHGADRVVAEANQGGDMVKSVLQAVHANLPVRLVHASRGKVARAEPVSALYETGRVVHVGGFAELEDQLCGMLIAGGYAGPGRSPDRADALVWAVSELAGNGRGEARVRPL
ncbi:ATP-binding protein [Sphingorhabdus soli]|uniref:ATP-binding protein n=1 Tax=Flavisphingopyxis soli TaxID=2601267 RepID=A0A5C6U993_9SPHN|nr:ATP-binding protein [Sphingorhabdus soli]